MFSSLVHNTATETSPPFPPASPQYYVIRLKISHIIFGYMLRNPSRGG